MIAPSTDANPFLEQSKGGQTLHIVLEFELTRFATLRGTLRHRQHRRA
jgi:hypothetical protein